MRPFLKGTLLAILMVAVSTMTLAQGTGSRQEGVTLARYAALWEQARAQGNQIHGEENAQNIEYFVGFVDGISAALEGRAWCSVRGMYTSQLAGAAAKYLRQNPERWHLPPSILVKEALATAFPCK